MFTVKAIQLFKRFFPSSTFKKLIFWNSFGVLVILLILNLFFYINIRDNLLRSLDARLTHEIDRVKKVISYVDGKVVVENYVELNEEDFKEITIHPFFLHIYNFDGRILLTSDNVRYFKNFPIDRENIYEENYLGRYNIDSLIIVYKISPLIDKSTGKPGAIIQLSTFAMQEKKFVMNIVLFNLLILPFIILSIFLSNFYITRRFISPIINVIDTAHRISLNELNNNLIITDNSDENVQKLVDAFNQFISRIKDYINHISQFSDNVAHQLLTPLTCLKSEIDFLLKKPRSGSEIISSLQFLSQQTDKLIRIVKVLLVIAKTEKLQESVNTIINFSNILKEEISLNNHNHLIEYEIEDAIFLKGDETHLRLVIQNLIDNALKFSSFEKKVKVKLLNKDDKVIFVVEDNGIGIDNVEKEKIFERFYRTKKCENLGIEGSGLGLCLVKSIVNSMKGEISIKDNQPTGTIFILRFPGIKID